MINEILAKAESIFAEIENDLIEFRHHLHEIPEIGLKEYKTSSAIRKKLAEYSILPLKPFLETDVAVLINPEKNNNVTIRADIDALPQTELNSFSYKSKCEGMMHACGHDGHAATLLGTAIIFNKLREFLPGSVRLIFQPGEEGFRGAEFLSKSELFNENKPKAVLGLHNIPSVQEGAFIGKPGILTSSVRPFEIEITGKSVHSSIPEQGIDPIIIGSKIINEFEKIVEDKNHILYKANLKICHFQSGTTDNIIPANAKLSGTARCFERQQEESFPEIIENITASICRQYSGKYKIIFKPVMKIINNDLNLYRLAEKNVKQMFGEEKWIEVPKPFMFSEDFSEYNALAPILMLGLGTGIERSHLHTQTFDFNDKIIKNGILFWIKMTLDILYKEII